MSEEVNPYFTAKVGHTMLWPKVITPEAFKTGGKLAYSASWLFDPEDPELVALKALASNVLREKWPGLDLRAAVAEKKLGLPWETGDAAIARKTEKLKDAGKEYTGGDDYKVGKVVLKTTTHKTRPKLAAVVMGKDVSLDTEELIKAHESKFYSGALGLFQIKLGTNEVEGKKFVTAYLNKIMTSGQGKQIGGGQSAAETFAGFAGTVSAEDPTQGVDDALLRDF